MTGTPLRYVSLLGTAVLVAGIGACGETSPSQPVTPGSVTVVGGQAQTGMAGHALPDRISVQVQGADGQPLPGVQVTFVAAGEGAGVDPASAVTDGDGIAQTRWTLPQTPGGAVLTATAGGVTAQATATVQAGPPASVVAVAGLTQAGQAGGTAATRPSVRVLDGFGNPVQGAAVTFTVVSGGGQATGVVQMTDAQGIATVGSWVFGPLLGQQVMIGRVEASGVTGNPVTFTANVAGTAATQLVIALGNNQTAPIGRAVPIPPRVVARDAQGNPVAGVVVTFAVVSGGGTAVASRQTTDGAGIAEVGAWFLGNTPGTNTLSASAQGITPVTFTATATAGAPATMLANSPTTQGGTVNTVVASPPSVLVRDIGGNPVPGVTVTFTVTAGGGAVFAAAGGAASTTAAVTTNNNGIATLAAWRLGATITTNTVVASVQGVPNVTFNATPSAGQPASVAAISGINATAVQGTGVAARPTVRVLDNSGNIVTGARVVFAVTGGGGNVTGAVQTTDAAGTATVGSWILGTGVPNTLTATVTDSVGNVLAITGNPVTFTAQSATAIELTSVPASGTRGQQFQISVRLENAAGDPVSLGSVPLTVAMTSGDGTLSGTLTVNTNVNGQATFTLTVTGGTAGNRVFTITGAGLTSAVTGSINFN